MGSGYQEQLAQMMTQLDGQRQKLIAAREEMGKQTAEVTSKDRMVTVVVGAQSELRELKFHTEQYRSMAPAELSKALVEVIEKARTQVREKLMKSAGPLAAMGDELRESMMGGSDLHAMIGDMKKLWPETGIGPALHQQPAARPAPADQVEDSDG
jgi:DNA-binding protein YbaB